MNFGKKMCRFEGVRVFDQLCSLKSKEWKHCLIRYTCHCYFKNTPICILCKCKLSLNNPLQPQNKQDATHMLLDLLHRGFNNKIEESLCCDLLYRKQNRRKEQPHKLGTLSCYLETEIGRDALTNMTPT